MIFFTFKINKNFVKNIHFERKIHRFYNFQFFFYGLGESGTEKKSKFFFEKLVFLIKVFVQKSSFFGQKL